MGGNEHKMEDKDLLRNSNSNAIKLLFNINSTWQASVKKNFELHILHGFHSLIASSWKTIQCSVLKLKTMSCDHQMN